MRLIQPLLTDNSGATRVAIVELAAGVPSVVDLKHGVSLFSSSDVSKCDPEHIPFKLAAVNTSVLGAIDEMMVNGSYELVQAISIMCEINDIGAGTVVHRMGARYRADELTPNGVASAFKGWADWQDNGEGVTA